MDATGIEHFPQKINIHFVIEGTMLEQVIAYNDILASNGSWINFRKGHVPHITLIMGRVKTKENYLAVENELRLIAPQINTFGIQLSKPYLKQPANRFVFSDILPDDVIRQSKQQIFEVVKPYMIPDQFGGPNNHPHLTLGYFPKKKNAVLPQQDWDPQQGTITDIGISRASMHGTSLPEYRKFALLNVD